MEICFFLNDMLSFQCDIFFLSKKISLKVIIPQNLRINYKSL